MVKKKWNLKYYGVIDIMENESFLFLYKKDGQWRVQYRHTKEEEIEIKGIILDKCKVCYGLEIPNKGGS